MRLRRNLIGMSQEKLGENLGVTFQQVQKYEKGTNRMGASRLFQISKTLNAPISYFFEGMPGGDTYAEGFAETGKADYVVDFLSSSQGLQLNRAFAKISNPKIRQRLVELVKTLAGESD